MLLQVDVFGELLKVLGMMLDVVIELKVDDEVLVVWIVKCVEELKVVGELVCCDDMFEVFVDCLCEYYKKIVLLLGYYYVKGDLKQVDGMVVMDVVGGQIVVIFDKLVVEV